jgi:hypothetical protein
MRSNTYKQLGQLSERDLTFQRRVLWYLLSQCFHSPFCLHCRNFLLLYINNFFNSEGIIQSESECVWQPSSEENIGLQTETITKYWRKLPTFGQYTSYSAFNNLGLFHAHLEELDEQEYYYL